MGPYEQGGPWNPSGITGIYRFLNRVWDILENSKLKAQNSKLQPKTKNLNLERLLNQTVKKVTEDIENFRFNTAISALMILVNEMQRAAYELNHGSVRTLLLLLAPFAPHITEELWHCVTPGVTQSVHNQKWPEYDPKLTEEEKIQLIIQINSRVRDKVEAPADISEEEAKALALKRENVRKWLEGKKIKKMIFVPKKLVNIVI